MPVIRVPDEAEAGVQRKKPAVTGAAPVPVMGLPEGGEPGVQRTEGTSPAPSTLPPPSMMNVPEGAAASVQAESPPGLAPEPSGEGAGARPVAKASFGEGAPPRLPQNRRPIRPPCLLLPNLWQPVTPCFWL